MGYDEDENNADDQKQEVDDDEVKERQSINEDDESQETNVAKMIGLLSAECDTIKDKYVMDTGKLKAMDAKQLTALSAAFSKWTNEFRNLEAEMVKCQSMASEIQKGINMQMAVDVNK